jgi:hypothetical protein
MPYSHDRTDSNRTLIEPWQDRVPSPYRCYCHPFIGAGATAKYPYTVTSPSSTDIEQVIRWTEDWACMVQHPWHIRHAGPEDAVRMSLAGHSRTQDSHPGYRHLEVVQSIVSGFDCVFRFFVFGGMYCSFCSGCLLARCLTKATPFSKVLHSVHPETLHFRGYQAE